MNNTKLRTAILLTNVGTPDEPTAKAVKKFLSDFLNDKYVMNIPWLMRKILVNLIIVPFRTKNSTKLYQQLWTPEGSPLMINAEKLEHKLQEKVGNEYTVFTGMRYQNPSIESVLTTIKEQGFEKLIIFPMYPHFASSTTETTFEEVKRVVKRWKITPELVFIDQFYTHPGYLNAYLSRIISYKPEEYDYILFSFHGLPNSHINKAHAGKKIADCNCEIEMPEHGRFCYKAACYHTARLFAERLNLSPDRHSISFQSRISRNWLMPFTDEVLKNLAKDGYKRVLVVTPSFVADCLETIIEIGVEYKKLFIENGGEKLTLVESLNYDDHWVDGIMDIVSDFTR